MKKAIITGITGQDGSYLSELLIQKGYEVHGIVKKETLNNIEKIDNIKNIKNSVFFHESDLNDRSTIFNIFSKTLPDECYHLSASSFVNYSFNNDYNTMNYNFNSTLYLLSAILEVKKNCKFFLAGSSEMFGEPFDTLQDEDSLFNPKSIYGISKLSCHYLLRNYREKKNIFACTGIMYNHESPRRGNQFVTKKIISSAVKIKAGLQKELYLGNLDAKRDWGYAPDFVKAMWKILQMDIAEDFVISTSKLHTVRDFLDKTFSYLGLNYKDYVKFDSKLFREAEKKSLCGNPYKIKKKLGWENTKNLDEIIKEMVFSEAKKYKIKLI
jgi:GDPmannose 4,6-dehydratase